jgi:hypothetical protein
MSARRVGTGRWTPQPKVAMTGLAGAITTILVALFAFEWSEELAAAVTTVIAFSIGYLTPQS